jgi:general secretion pathway protein K
MKRRKAQAKKGQEGVALILALLFIVLLSAIVVEFAYDAQVDASLATNFGRDFEAYIAAKSAVHDGMAVLQENVITFLEGTAQGGTPQQVGEYYDGADQPWYTGTAFSPLNDANMRATIRDEYGKINLNALLFYTDEGQEPTENTPLIEATRYFFDRRTESDIGLDIVEAILDWIDHGEDDDERENGAENDYYMGLETPFSAKNGPMDSIEELLLIPGITPDVYYGDANADPPQKPLSEYFTVHGNLVGDININTAELETVESVLVGYFGEGPAESVMESLYTGAQQNPINPVNNLPVYDSQGVLDSIMQNAAQRFQPENTNDPNNPQQQPQAQKQQRQPGQPNPRNPNGQQNPNARLTGVGGGHIFITTSNVFRIYGDGESGDALVRIEAYVFRQITANETNYIPPPGVDQNNAENLVPQELFRVLDWKVIR